MPQTQGSSFLATLGLETESLRDSQFETECLRDSWYGQSFRGNGFEIGCFFFSGAFDVSQEVEDFVSGQQIHKTFGHRGDFGWMPIGNIRFSDRDALRGEQVGLDDDISISFIHDSTGSAVAIFLNNGIALVLFGNDFGRFEYGLEDFAAAVFAWSGGQFRSNGTAFVAEAMAHEALGIIEGGFAVFEIPAMRDLRQGRLEIGHCPFFDEATTFCWLISNPHTALEGEASQRVALLVGKHCYSIFTDIFEILHITNAVAIIAAGFLKPANEVRRMIFGGFGLIGQEISPAAMERDLILALLLQIPDPLEVMFTLIQGPAALEVAKVEYVMDLFFLS